MKTFIWLLKREYWEHKGGLLWAPVIVGCLMCALLAVGLVGGGLLGHNFLMEVNGESLADAASALSPAHRERVVQGLGIGLFTTLVLLFFIPSFVTFFFCLGTLFDERRDRSVLFWKSLPVSDSATVLSKVAVALLLAPLIAWVVASITGLVVYLLAVLGAGMMGGATLAQAMFQPRLALAPFQLAALLPIYALWALPTVGWLLLVSVWARSKPFLWAVGAPIAAGVLLSWLNRMLNLQWNVSWYWEHVVARGLLSNLPGSWLSGLDKEALPRHAPGFGDVVVSSWQVAATPGLWIGVALGAAMIYGAIQLRSRRDED